MNLLSLPPNFPSALARGRYTIRQRSTGRFLDAHEIPSKDFAVVTRPSQSNDTQKWVILPVGGIYTLQQSSNGRFVDAHESGHDFGAVTREAQGNATQRWILGHLGNGVFSLQQQSSGRFLDAHEIESRDFAAVTRTAQDDASQRWIMRSAGGNKVTILQQKTGRFLDAHEISAKDFQLVTRPEQNNETQRWIVSPVAAICEVQQLSSLRHLDAHDNADHDFAAVTRLNQENDTQRWLVTRAGNGSFSLVQMSSNRFLDAHETEARDFAAVTRPAQNNPTQQWDLTLTLQADLQAFNFDIQPGPGNRFSARGIVHNVGQLPVKGPFKIALGVTTPAGTRQLDTRIPATTTIAPGGTLLTDPIRDIPKTPGSTCVVEMIVDSEFQIPDALRANNTLQKSFSF